MTDETDNTEFYASMGMSAYESGGGQLAMETNGTWFSVWWPDRDGSGMSLHSVDELLAFLSGVRRGHALKETMEKSHVGADVAEHGCLVCDHRARGGTLDDCGPVPIQRICLDCLALFAGRMCEPKDTGGKPPGATGQEQEKRP